MSKENKSGLIQKLKQIELEDPGGSGFKRSSNWLQKLANFCSYSLNDCKHSKKVYMGCIDIYKT